MLKHIVLLPLLAVLAGSCEKDEAAPRALEAIPAGYLDFQDLQVGQRSLYLLAGIDLRAGVKEPRYTGDTLVLEVTGREGNVFEVTETFTPGSPNRDSVHTRYCDVIRYGLSVENDVLQAVRTVDCAASYLFGELPQALPLSPQAARAELDGWRVRPFDDGNDDLILNGFVEGFTTLGVRYERLNILVDPRQEPFDGSRFVWLYDGRAGVVRYLEFNEFSGQGRVADLLLVQD